MAERIQLIAGHIASKAADTASLLAFHSKEIATQHPVASAALGTGAALVAGPSLLAGPAMVMAGFGPSGIAPVSLAATVHSAIGNVATGSAFAILQSAATGGSGVAVVNSVVQGAGLGIAAGGAVMAYFAPQSTENDEDEEPGNKADEDGNQEL